MLRAPFPDSYAESVNCSAPYDDSSDGATSEGRATMPIVDSSNIVETASHYRRIPLHNGQDNAVRAHGITWELAKMVSLVYRS